jgi:hypothetical protein
MKMKREKVISFRFLSTLLASVLIAGAVTSAPASFGADMLQVHTEAELIAAGIDPTALNVQIMADINLNTKLLINHSMTITCGVDCTTTTPALTGMGIEITSGAIVTMSYLNLNGLQNYPGQANYGIAIQDGSHLNASYLNMTYNQTGLNDNVVGFRVFDGSSLNLSNSSLVWGTNVAGLQQYAVYTESGAGPVGINTSNFDFSSRNTLGAYSVLVGVDGELVATYPKLTLLNLHSDAYMQLHLSGTDTLANNQAWAYPNVSGVAGNNRVGIIGSGRASVYTRNLNNWAVNVVDQVIVPTASEVNYVGYTLTATTDTIFVDLADVYAYQFAYIDVKKQVLVSGKLLWRYVPVDLVVLDAYGRSTITTLVGIKLGDTIRVSMAGYPDNIVVRWQLVK